MTEAKNQQQQILKLVCLSFILSAICFATSIFFPPKQMGEVVVMGTVLVFLARMQTAFFIIGTTAYSILLAEKKQTIGAVSFALLSITDGVIFVLYLVSYRNEEDMREAFQLFSGSMFLMIPSYIILCMYNRFGWWIRIMGLLGCFAFAAENISFAVEGHYQTYMMWIDGTGNILLNITTLCWGIVLMKEIRNQKTEIA